MFLIKNQTLYSSLHTHKVTATASPQHLCISRTLSGPHTVIMINSWQVIASNWYRVSFEVQVCWRTAYPVRDLLFIIVLAIHQFTILQHLSTGRICTTSHQLVCFSCHATAACSWRLPLFSFTPISISCTNNTNIKLIIRITSQQRHRGSGRKLQLSNRQLQISDWGDMGAERFQFCP